MALTYAHDTKITVTVNGHAVHSVVSPRTTLLDWLREEVGLTGTKKGCNEGACGTCTVLVDGRRMNGCLTLAVQCDGRAVTTVEGLAQPDGELHPVQRAFRDLDAFQCGYCTPGQLISATACIAEGHATDAASVREWMSGNICRCSSYPQITAAVLAAAEAVADPSSTGAVADPSSTEAVADPSSTEAVADPSSTGAVADPSSTGAVADPSTADGSAR